MRDPDVDFNRLDPVHQRGKQLVEADYIAPSGKVSSKPLPFTIRDKGNLYKKVVRSIKPGPDHAK
jgi:hypothetical protein